MEVKLKEQNVNIDNMEGRELTLGEIRVGVTFNPTENKIVTKVKSTYAGLIDRLEMDRLGGNKERNRTISRAQTAAEDACMLTVKSLFQ